MGTLSIHPVEYLRLHVQYEAMKTRLLRSLQGLVREIFASSEQVVTGAVVILTVGLVVVGCMKIAESASVAAHYDSAITEMVLPPLPAIPMGM